MILVVVKLTNVGKEKLSCLCCSSSGDTVLIEAHHVTNGWAIAQVVSHWLLIIEVTGSAVLICIQVTGGHFKWFFILCAIIK
jgi:hypothetical protein